MSARCLAPARPRTRATAHPRDRAPARPFCNDANLPMNLRDGLKEISYGDWEGLTREEVRDRFGEDYSRWETEPA